MKATQAKANFGSHLANPPLELEPEDESPNPIPALDRSLARSLLVTIVQRGVTIFLSRRLDTYPMDVFQGDPIS